MQNVSEGSAYARIHMLVTIAIVVMMGLYCNTMMILSCCISRFASMRSAFVASMGFARGGRASVRQGIQDLPANLEKLLMYFTQTAQQAIASPTFSLKTCHITNLRAN
jgi:hypothetical protein